MGIFDRFNRSIGVDLGTANSSFYMKGKGIMVSEPTIIAVNNKTGQIVAIGEEARRMVDRTPQHITVIKPLSSGVVSDFEMAEELVKHFLHNSSEGPIGKFGIAVMGVPTNLTEVERKSAEDVLFGSGASKVFFVNSALAAALGARLPLEEPAANMIIGMGGGITELAVLSVGGVVISKSLKIAGNKFNDDIIKFVRDEFQLAIGEPTAEEIKIRIGSALPAEERLEMMIRGRDLASGLPKEIVIKNSHVRSAIAKSLKVIADSARATIEEAPPELVGDILERGIFLCGGSSLLRDMDRYLERETTVHTVLVDDPRSCVIRGLGIIVEEFDKYGKLLASQVTPRVDIVI